MPTNILHTITLRSTLRISQGNVEKAKSLIPDRRSLDYLIFNADGIAEVTRFPFYGEFSATRYGNGSLAAFVALLEGEAELVLIWESGDLEGLRIHEGKMTCAKIVLSLDDQAQS